MSLRSTVLDMKLIKNSGNVMWHMLGEMIDIPGETIEAMKFGLSVDNKETSRWGSVKLIKVGIEVELKDGAHYIGHAFIDPDMLFLSLLHADKLADISTGAVQGAEQLGPFEFDGKREWVILENDIAQIIPGFSEMIITKTDKLVFLFQGLKNNDGMELGEVILHFTGENLIRLLYSEFSESCPMVKMSRKVEEVLRAGVA